MNRCQRTAENLNKLVKKFLTKNELYDNDTSTDWEIKPSELGGFGIFANRDFNVGEVILTDCPVIIGPRCAPNCPKVCVNCFSKGELKSCKKNCGLQLCSDECQDSFEHQKECKTLREYLQIRCDLSDELKTQLFENLTPIRSLLLNEEDKEVVSCLIAHDRDKHGHEVDVLKNLLKIQFKEFDEEFVRFVCCVMDANAFEVALRNETGQSSVRGLYPVASLANHSCTPNTAHVFNERREMVVKASVFIPKNSEIFHCYTRLIWGTTTRLFHLRKTKHFTCKCARCTDPTEFGTYMGSVLCKLCRGLVSPVNPYKAVSRWQCRDCKHVITGKEAGEVTSLLGSILWSIDDNDFPVMHRFLNGRLKTLVPETNQVTVELKFKILWVLGYKPGYTWNGIYVLLQLTLEQLKIKEEICNELLSLLEQLRCGRCKLRGVLLYNLFCCKKELFQRKHPKENPQLTSKDDNILYELLGESASIFEFDVTAPKEVVEYWTTDKLKAN